MPRDYIVFNEAFEEDINADNKTETLRFGWKSVPTQNSTVEARNPSGEVIAKLRITSVDTITIQDAADQTFEGHANYETVEECIQELSEYYDHDFTSETELIHLQFTRQST